MFILIVVGPELLGEKRNYNQTSRRDRSWHNKKKTHTHTLHIIWYWNIAEPCPRTCCTDCPFVSFFFVGFSACMTLDQQRSGEHRGRPRRKRGDRESNFEHQDRWVSRQYDYFASDCSVRAHGCALLIPWNAESNECPRSRWAETESDRNSLWGNLLSKATTFRSRGGSSWNMAEGNHWRNEEKLLLVSSGLAARIYPYSSYF